ncbi:hypothetical protein [Polaromonas sp.]|uniref:hypothetical protein n=1 Tax=Polaromonas sp. TaxID=1869339 RepID=UPI003266F4A2
MPLIDSAAAPNPNQLTPEVQAAALWTFVQLKAPRFSFDDALDVVNELKLREGEDPRTVAQRLRKTLQARRIAFKHTHALHAASRLAGYSSWHTNEHADTPRLRFTTLDRSEGLTPESLQMGEFKSWDGLATELRRWTDQLYARGQLPLGVLALKFADGSVHFSTPVPPDKDSPNQQAQFWPLATVTPLLGKDGWLEDAPPALEKLRRHLEENGQAVLDGYAVLHLCASTADHKGIPGSVGIADAVNTELVLIREDDENDPHAGYEIARGDELTCWHQLELSLRNDTTDETPVMSITVPDEGNGAWFVNGIRYVWVLETLKPHEYVPGRVHRFLGILDCVRLLRRYRLTKRIHGGTFKHHEQTKNIGYLSGVPETYRVDLHFLLHLLKAANLTAEGYFEKFGVEPLPMQDRLPVGFVFQLLQNLKVEKPNLMFAKPNISEMERVDDDGLLRALMPRIDSVRSGVLPRGLEEERVKELHKALEDFGSSLRVRMMTAGNGQQTEKELPYLLYASEAEQLRTTVQDLGLTMYAAVMPNLLSTKGLVPDSPDAWPWALGHALFVRFERQGDVQ